MSLSARFHDLRLVEISHASVKCCIEPPPHDVATSLETQARVVMTDFGNDHPIVIAPDKPVQDALALMQSGRVRMLIVASASGDFRGLIRSIDLLGPAPVIAAQLNGVMREEVLVRDVMRPKKMIHALDMDVVENARIGDVLNTLKHLGEPDILVIDSNVTPAMIRGVLSVSDISRELRLDFEIDSKPMTFTELGRAL